MIVTIDGPVASGKSTVGKLIAQYIGAYYIYTGLLYRALAYILMRDYGYKEEDLLKPTLDDVHRILTPGHLLYLYTSHHGEQITYKGDDLTAVLKDPVIDHAASVMSTSPEIRSALMQFQRNLAEGHDVVVDGRDAGSVVFPEAHYKFYLTADLKERAQRWKASLETKGTMVSLDQALRIIEGRDQRDTARATAPLVIPRGAFVIDSTGLNIQAVVNRIMGRIQRV